MSTVGLLLLSSCQQRRAGTLHESDHNMDDIGITTIAKGNYSGVDESIDLVIESEEDWRELWGKIYAGTYPVKEPPDIDFSRQTVLAAFLGTRSTGGYSIEFSRLVKENSKIKAIFTSKSPEPGDMVTTALSQPYHVVSIGVADKDIEIIRE
jgi:hypothetical protein